MKKLNMSFKGSMNKLPMMRYGARRSRPIKVKRLAAAFLLVVPTVIRAQFNYVTNDDDTITITQYTGAAGVGVVIPDTITGMYVTVIGDESFFSANITNVAFPSHLASIGQGAFSNNFGWDSPVTIPEGVTNVGSGAFGSTDITQLSLPASLTTIGEAAFSSVYGLTNITMDPANTNFLSSADGVLFSHDQTELIQYPADRSGAYIIPATVTQIGTQAFSGCLRLPSISVPNAVTNIGDYAFGNTQNLYTIHIGTKVTALGYGDFQTAFSLQGVYFAGNAPTNFLGEFTSGTHAIVYYLPGTTGWQSHYDIAPTELWNPTMSTPGIRTNAFGFSLAGSTNLPYVVQAATNPASNDWATVYTGTLTTNGAGYFSDLNSALYGVRFYRLTQP